MGFPRRRRCSPRARALCRPTPRVRAGWWGRAIFFSHKPCPAGGSTPGFAFESPKVGTRARGCGCSIARQPEHDPSFDTPNMDPQLAASLPGRGACAARVRAASLRPPSHVRASAWSCLALHMTLRELARCVCVCKSWKTTIAQSVKVATVTSADGARVKVGRGVEPSASFQHGPQQLRALVPLVERVVFYNGAAALFVTGEGDLKSCPHLREITVRRVRVGCLAADTRSLQVRCHPTLVSGGKLICPAETMLDFALLVPHLPRTLTKLEVCCAARSVVSSCSHRVAVAFGALHAWLADGSRKDARTDALGPGAGRLARGRLALGAAEVVNARGGGGGSHVAHAAPPARSRAVTTGSTTSPRRWLC